jgi:peptidoglycan/LPS O-acetylase OafA/YrhL
LIITLLTTTTPTVSKLPLQTEALCTAKHAPVVPSPAIGCVTAYRQQIRCDRARACRKIVFMEKTQRVASLDGLRGIAVALVVLFHYGHGLENIPALGAIVSRGWMGVDLFFVMSGFLIGGIVIANKETENLFSVFYLRRFLRIFPLYYALLLIVAALIATKLMAPSTKGLAAYFLYLQNLIGDPSDFGPTWLQATWSLAVEEQFYLLLPVVVVLTPIRFLGAVMVSGILASLGLRIAAFLIPLHQPFYFILFFTPCRGSALLFGVLLAWLIRRRATSISLERRVAVCYAGAAGSLLALILAHGQPVIGLSIVGPLFFFIVALAIMHVSGPVAILTRMSWLRWLGIRTYAIYLAHIPALAAVKSFFEWTTVEPHGLTRPLALAFTFGFAALSWRWLEAPLIAVGHRLKYGSGTKAPVLAIY